MPSVRASYEVGMDFVAFLGERKSKTDKKELRDIYNTEFKRDGAKGPHFNDVVYALQKFNKASVRQGKVHLFAKPQVRVYFCDQWRAAASQKSSSVTSGLSGSSPPDHVASPPSPRSSPSLVTPVLTPKRQLVKEILRRLKANRAELVADKGGIEIISNPGSTNGKVQFHIEYIDKVFVVKFHIVNKGNSCVHFTFYTALHRIRCFSLLDERRVTRVCPLLLCPGESYDVEVRYQVRHYGHFPATMYFEFCPESEPPDQPQPFCVVRELEAVICTALAAELGPVAPFKARSQARYRPVDRVVEEGEPPTSSFSHPLKMVVRLKEYKYPSILKELVQYRLEDSDRLSPAARRSLPATRELVDSPLCMKNYARRFHLLLYLEEIQMEVDIKKYDLHNQTMSLDTVNRKLLVLQVPGVAENRPSVLRGDYLNVSLSEDKVQPITVYKGYVHRVELERVKLGFSKKLLQRFMGCMRFDVEFSISRLPLKLQHRAVELANKHSLGPVLFPSSSAARDTPLPHVRSLCPSSSTPL